MKKEFIKTIGKIALISILTGCAGTAEVVNNKHIIYEKQNLKKDNSSPSVSSPSVSSPSVSNSSVSQTNTLYAIDKLYKKAIALLIYKVDKLEKSDEMQNAKIDNFSTSQQLTTKNNRTIDEEEVEMNMKIKKFLNGKRLENEDKTN